MFYPLLIMVIWSLSFLQDTYLYEIISYDELNLVNIDDNFNCSLICQISYLKYMSLPTTLDNSKYSFSLDNITKIEDGLCVNDRKLAAENLIKIEVTMTRLEIVLNKNNECKGLQFYVMLVEASKNLSELLEFKSIENENFYKIEEKIQFMISLNYSYQVNVRVKSILDSRQFILGTYLLNSDFVLPNEKMELKDEIPIISILSINFTNIWFFKDTKYSHNKTIDELIFVLKETSKYKN